MAAYAIVGPINTSYNVAEPVLTVLRSSDGYKWDKVAVGYAASPSFDNCKYTGTALTGAWAGFWLFNLSDIDVIDGLIAMLHDDADADNVAIGVCDLCVRATDQDGNSIATSDQAEEIIEDTGTTLPTAISDLQTHGDSNWSTATGFAEPGDAMTLHSDYDAAKTAAQAGDAMTLEDGAITAAKIAASALDNKGNWNVGKTGYTLSQTFPSNFAALGINSSGHIQRVVLVDTTTANTDMRGTDNAVTSLSGIATSSELSSLQSHGDSNWATATGFAESGDAMTLTSDYDAAKTAAQASALSAAQADLDTLTDASGEPGQGAPPESASFITKVAYLYKAWRNKHTQTASAYNLYADNGSTVDQKADVSDDNTTFERGEMESGA